MRETAKSPYLRPFHHQNGSGEADVVAVLAEGGGGERPPGRLRIGVEHVGFGAKREMGVGLCPERRGEPLPGDVGWASWPGHESRAHIG